MQHLAKHIAAVLKDLRQARGWSLDKTAQATGVSKAMLGQIEREESSPTVAVLWKIASGFNTSFSTFLKEVDVQTEENSYLLSQSVNYNLLDNKMRIVSLFPFDERLHCEIFLIELLVSCEHLSNPHQAGVIEDVLVVEGKMEVLVDANWRTLYKGEGLRFRADQFHGYRNNSKEKASFHNIIYYPVEKSL